MASLWLSGISQLRVSWLWLSGISQLRVSWLWLWISWLLWLSKLWRVLPRVLQALFPRLLLWIPVWWLLPQILVRTPVLLPFLKWEKNADRSAREWRRQQRVASATELHTNVAFAYIRMWAMAALLV